MEIGIFSRTYARPSLDGVLDAIASRGLSRVHFNLKSAGVESLPRGIGDDLCSDIHGAFQRCGLTMTSISATFNAIHPDETQRRDGIDRACHLIERTRTLGAAMVSLCTGTRDANDMWKRHPDNDLPDAWSDLRNTLGALLPAAQQHGVILGIEPELTNVVNSAAKARRLLDELQSPHLKIILDGANLIEDVADQSRTLAEAFCLLASDIVMIHAKDVADPPAHPSQAAGKGRLDWDSYCRLIHDNCPAVPVILHNLAESEVAESLVFIKDRLAHAVS